MTNLTEVWDKFESEFLRFERIESPLHEVPDICAFLMLYQLDVLDRATGGGRIGKPMDIISAAEHDEIWLNASCEKLAANATEEQIRDLIRCGVRYDARNDALAMFV